MERFELTPELIKLLQSAYVTWEGPYSGAPAIDAKRPYGNKDVAGDIESILTGKRSDDLSEERENELLRLHEKTATALQIILVTGSFTPGIYEKTDMYRARSWVLVREDFSITKHSFIGDGGAPCRRCGNGQYNSMHVFGEK